MLSKNNNLQDLRIYAGLILCLSGIVVSLREVRRMSDDVLNIMPLRFSCRNVLTQEVKPGTRVPRYPGSNTPPQTVLVHEADKVQLEADANGEGVDDSADAEAEGEEEGSSAEGGIGETEGRSEDPMRKSRMRRKEERRSALVNISASWS